MADTRWRFGCARSTEVGRIASWADEKRRNVNAAKEKMAG